MMAETDLQGVKRERAKAAHLDLTQWRSIAEFNERVDLYDSTVVATDLLHSRDFNFLTEALALAEFVRLHPVDAVRLSGEEHPDAYVRVRNQEIGVEITEALNIGRRRGDEYRGDAPKLEHVSQEEMEEHRRQLEPAITRAIEKKLHRGNEKLILLVYVELQIHFELTNEEEALVTEIKHRFCSQFRDLYIICKGKLY